MEEFERTYPEKPFLEEKKMKNSLVLTVFSVFVFIWAFVVFVSSDWRFISIIIAVLLVHESGHLLAMKRFQYKSLKMLFIPFLGALVQGEKEVYSQRQRAIVLLSGPFPGILIGVFLMYLGGQHHGFWMMYAGLLFVSINTLNLLPIDPLDGGQLMQVLFFNRREFYQLIFAFISSLLLIFIGLYFEYWLIVLFGFLLGVRVRSYQKLYQIRNDLKTEEVEYTKNYNQLSNREYHLIRKMFLKHSPSASRILEYSIADTNEMEELISNEVNNILEAPTNKDINTRWKILFCSIWLLGLGLACWIMFREIANLTWFMNAFQSWR